MPYYVDPGSPGRVNHTRIISIQVWRDNGGDAVIISEERAATLLNQPEASEPRAWTPENAWDLQEGAPVPVAQELQE